MLDFNAKKEVLRNLRAKRSKNKLMWLPCVIAELFVKLWYALLCTIDMALSDKHGNFLGVKRNKNRADKPKKRRQDDIVYVKRPFWGRFVSAVLAFSFVFMMVPDLGVFDFSAFADDEYVQLPGSTYYYYAPDWDVLKIKDTNTIIGNGSARIYWEVVSGKPEKYKIEYENLSNGVTTLVSDTWKTTYYTFSELSSGTSFEFTVTALKTIKLYELVPADPTADPPRLTDQYKSVTTYDIESESITYILNSKLNSVMDLPVLQEIEYNESNSKATLKWTHVAQQGYTLDDRPADGYIIYRADVNSSNSAITKYTQIGTIIASKAKKEYETIDGKEVTYIVYEDSVIQGMIYEYYVVAYRDIFGDTGGQYSPSSPGIITSSGEDGAIKQSLITMPTSPVIKSITSNKKDTLTITWQPGAGNTDGYIVFRSDNEITDAMVTNAGYDSLSEYLLYYNDSSIIKLGELSENDKSYSDNSDELINTRIYWYYVISFVVKNNSNNRLYSVPDNVSGKINASLDTPQWTSVSTEDGQVTLKWKSVTNADGYRIYITKTKNYTGSVTGLGDLGYVDVGNVTTYSIENLLNGDQYSYKIMAYSNVKTETGNQLFSNYSDSRIITVGIELDTPQDMKVTTKDGQNTVTWSAVQGADGYVLYYQCNGGTWKSIDLSKTTFNHTGLNNDDVYNYYVKAYKTIDKSYDENNDGKEQIVYSDSSVIVTIKVGETLDAPKDFTAETSDGVVNLSWTKVDGAEGYILYAYSGGRTYEFDVSKTKYEHTGLNNGDVWTYWLVAYKTVNGERTYSDSTQRKTVTIGVSLSAAVDLVATAGNHQIDLTWTKVNGAEGYVVYIYDESTMEFEALTVTSKTSYSHVGLRNGKEYTYMVAAFKTINGECYYGEYSMAVSATPTNGSTSDVNRTLTVKGTTPYGISHSEYISAKCNYDAFDESVDVYFTTNKESTAAVKDVLRHYAKGLSSFIIYPFDISIYKENTLIEVEPNDGYSVTVTMPVPDKLIAYRDYITVVHINEEAGAEEGTTSEWYEVSDQRLEVLPCAILDIDNVWCIQFVCSSFSPYAFVIYKEHINDVSAGSGVADGSFAGTFNSGVLLFTTLPDIMPENRKLRIVKGKKRYKVKNITTV